MSIRSKVKRATEWTDAGISCDICGEQPASGVTLNVTSEYAYSTCTVCITCIDALHQEGDKNNAWGL